MIVEMSGASTKISNPEVTRVFICQKQKQTCRFLLFGTLAINCVKLKNMLIFSSTRLQDSNESKTFAFDYSYWSFDGSKDRGDGYQMPDKGHSNGSKFCDQEKVI